MGTVKRSLALLVFVGLTDFALAQNDGRAWTHVFPQFVDGKFSDGTYYRSTLSLISPTSETGTCTLRLNGITTVLENTAGRSFTLGSLTLNLSAGAGGWYIARSQGTASFQAGYATVNCSVPQTAHVIYSFYAANGTKLSEATVFSSPPGTLLEIAADQRDGARLGVAIANDTAAASTVTLSAYIGGTSLSAQIVIPASSSYARFLDEAIPGVPPNQAGAVTIASDTTVEAIGLRVTGAAFTTIPSTVLAP
jgi:hypothetical protein